MRRLLRKEEEEEVMVERREKEERRTVVTTHRAAQSSRSISGITSERMLHTPHRHTDTRRWRFSHTKDNMVDKKINSCNVGLVTAFVSTYPRPPIIAFNTRSKRERCNPFYFGGCRPRITRASPRSWERTTVASSVCCPSPS